MSKVQVKCPRLHRLTMSLHKPFFSCVQGLFWVKKLIQGSSPNDTRSSSCSMLLLILHGHRLIMQQGLLQSVTTRVCPVSSKSCTLGTALLVENTPRSTPGIPFVGRKNMKTKRMVSNLFFFFNKHPLFWLVNSAARQNALSGLV